MDARTAVLTLIAIKPHPLKDLVNRLPYAKPTVYEAVRILEEKGLVKIKDGLVLVADRYKAKKTADIHILALSYGIDPELLMRESTISIWSTLERSRTYKDIQDLTGYSHVTVKKAVAYLERKGLVNFLKRKPVIAVRNDPHPVNEELQLLFRGEENGQTYHYPGTIPFNERFVKPKELEKVLFDKIEKGITVKDTGFLVKDESGDITILESTDKIPSKEEIFLKKLVTTEGTEDLCIKMIKIWDLDFEELLSLSIDRGLVSVVGCYFDILNDIEGMVPGDIVGRFLEHFSNKKMVFLEEEKVYGKSGWEERYEDKWNVDLYLDLDAVKHGVRSA